MFSFERSSNSNFCAGLKPGAASSAGAPVAGFVVFVRRCRRGPDVMRARLIQRLLREHRLVLADRPSTLFWVSQQIAQFAMQFLIHADRCN